MLMWCWSPERSFGRPPPQRVNKIKNPKRLSLGFKCGVGVPNEASGEPPTQTYKIKNFERLSSGF